MKKLHKLKLLLAFLALPFVFNQAHGQLTHTATDPAVQAGPAGNPPKTQYSVGEVATFQVFLSNNAGGCDVEHTMPAGAVEVYFSYDNRYYEFVEFVDSIYNPGGIDLSEGSRASRFSYPSGSIYFTNDRELLNGGCGDQGIYCFFRLRTKIAHENVPFSYNVILADPIKCADLLTTNNGTGFFTTIMPVTITSYKVQKADCNNAQLNWTIENAINFHHFEVERSSDNNNFTSVGTVNYVSGMDAYSFKDMQLADGKYQYRLRCVDVGGAYKLGEIKTVSIKCHLNGITVLPTLATSQIRVKGASGSVDVKVFSMKGQLMIEKKNLDASDQLDVSRLANGSYAVQVWQNGEMVKSTSIIKM